MTDPRIPEMKEYLKANLSEHRFTHSLNVAAAAKKLAEINGADPDKCYLAGLLHDICKEIPPQTQYELMMRSGYLVSEVEIAAPKTHHAVAGAQFIREFYNITDPDICDSIRWHTVGRGGMTLYEKIIYMADLISDERSYPGAEEIRADTYSNLDRGLYEAFCFMLTDQVSKKRLIPQSTFDAYNEYTVKELARLSDKI